MDKFREEVQREDDQVMQRKVSEIDQARGFGGKFGIEEDRMDKSAVGHDYQVKEQQNIRILLKQIAILTRAHPRFYTF